MSNFIDGMFCEKGRTRPVLERMGDIRLLDMTSSVKEAIAQPKRIIEFEFKATWRMNAHGTAEEYDEIHKVAMSALKRAVFEEFYDKLTYLELALYDHDVDKGKEIIREIKREINL